MPTSCKLRSDSSIRPRASNRLKHVQRAQRVRQILELAFSGSASRYDGRRTDPHPRVVCLICERIDHPDFAEPAILRALIAETTGYDVTNHRLDFSGRAPTVSHFGAVAG